MAIDVQTARTPESQVGGGATQSRTRKENVGGVEYVIVEVWRPELGQWRTVTRTPITTATRPRVPDRESPPYRLDLREGAPWASGDQPPAGWYVGSDGRLHREAERAPAPKVIQKLPSGFDVLEGDSVVRDGGEIRVWRGGAIVQRETDPGYKPPTTIDVAGGIEERKLAAQIAADAANQEYLRARLNMESEANARQAALQAAEQEIARIDQSRRFGLSLAEYLNTLRGPQNYGTYFNVLSQRPGQPLGTGVSERLLSVLSGLSRIAATPNFNVPGGVDLGFEGILRSLFTGAGLLTGPTVTPGAPTPERPVQFSGYPNPQQFNRLMPTEQKALVSMAEAAGIPAEDYLGALERSLPGALPVARPRLGVSSLRI